MLKGNKPVFLVSHRGALGDFLLALPALAQIRFKFPKHHFIGLGQTDYLNFAKSLGLFDSIAHHESRTFLPFYDGKTCPPELKPLHTALFYSEKNPEITQLCKDIGTHKIVFWPPHPSESIHAIDHHLSLLNEFGIKPPEQAHFLPAPPAQTPKTLIHPGAGSAAKRFNPEFYLFVANELKNLGYPDIHFLLGPQEQDLATHYKAHYPILTPDNLSICYQDLGGCVLYIGNDSGVSHLAALCGVPTVAFYKENSIKQWGIKGPASYSLEAPTEAQAMAKLQKHIRTLSVTSAL